MFYYVDTSISRSLVTCIIFLGLYFELVLVKVFFFIYIEGISGYSNLVLKWLAVVVDMQNVKYLSI